MVDKTNNELLTEFVVTNSDYYTNNFEKIGSKSGFTWTFNWMVAILEPVWLGMSGLWNWRLPFAILFCAMVLDRVVQGKRE